MTEKKLEELLRCFQKGEKRAGEKILLQLQPLVRAYARRMARRDGEEDDYFQVGAIGLLKAAARFNPERGVGFITFAASWIEGEMRLYRRETFYPFKVSRSLIEQSRELACRHEQLTQSLQREPTVKEIARVMKVDLEEVALIMESTLPPCSLDEKLPGGAKVRNEQEELLERMALRESMIRLTPLERQLITLRFFEELTQAEIAGRLNLSQRQVSRLEKRILCRMRSYMNPENPNSNVSTSRSMLGE